MAGVAAGPLLETKLHVPRRPTALVERSRLAERLRAGDRAALTLVSAPAGFGKTTLLADWLGDEGDRALAWVSLDAQDDDPARFWAYVLAALERAAGVGAEAQALLDGGPQPIEPVLVALVNELAAHDGDVTLVLDDLHAVTATEVHDGLAFLVEHLPAQAHLVLATRVDPPLPLARLRAGGRLVELRAADLRFSVDEARGYLAGMGLELDPADVATLEARTEGWIAALQLAALSMQGRDDPGAFVAGFAGDDRFVVDYLVGEVLALQGEDRRRFLLDTSVLHRLSGPLCDAVTGGSAGAATLDELDRANLFVVPLDDRRRWYRYHHLFAEVLRAHLDDEAPDRVPDLHRRASAWWEAEGDRAEAIDHALAGGAVERAADLVELEAPELRRARMDVTLRDRLDALPPEVYEHRPVLTVAWIGSRMVHGEVDGVAERLDAAERSLADPTTAVVVDEHEAARLPGQIAMYRAGLAHLAGDPEAAIGHAHEVLRLVDDGDHLGRGAAQALLALAHWGRGELEAAEGWEAQAVDSMGRAGHVADRLGCTLGLADIQVARGRPADARRTLESGLAAAARRDGSVVRGTADLHVALAEVALEQGDLDEAHAQLDGARALGDGAALVQYPYRSRVVAARLLEAEGDLAGAVALLDEAEPLYTTDYSPSIRPVAAVRARVHLAQGDVAAARRWADRAGVTPHDELGYEREYEHRTLALLLQAEGAEADAATLLARLDARPAPDSRARADQAGLVEPLSERELEVLRLLRSELSGPEIARELYVSVNTLRTHTRHIYEKLAVTSRRAAVRRAEELGL